jgi:hypothetical protein
MSTVRNRVAAANAAVERDLEEYSDNEDEAENGNIGELDTSVRLNQPQSHNRSLLELYRMLNGMDSLIQRTRHGRTVHEYQP